MQSDGMTSHQAALDVTLEASESAKQKTRLAFRLHAAAGKRSELWGRNKVSRPRYHDVVRRKAKAITASF
jgi:hypothetical protein